MTDLTLIDPAFYTVLKKKQQDFIHLMDAVCPAGATEFTRGDLKKIANDNGIAWAPAWIVKDQSRVVKRGVYRVPELQAWRNYKADAAKDDAAFAAAANAMIDAGMEKIGESIDAHEAAADAILGHPAIQCDDCPTADCVDCPVRPDHISEGAWGLLTEEEQMAATA